MFIYLLFENKKKCKGFVCGFSTFYNAWIYKQKDTAELQ